MNEKNIKIDYSHGPISMIISNRKILGFFLSSHDTKVRSIKCVRSPFCSFSNVYACRGYFIPIKKRVINDALNKRQEHVAHYIKCVDVFVIV
jgi:hypothetical protein